VAHATFAPGGVLLDGDHPRINYAVVALIRISGLLVNGVLD
jgi:hypothetical protein